MAHPNDEAYDEAEEFSYDNDQSGKLNETWRLRLDAEFELLGEIEAKEVYRNRRIPSDEELLSYDEEEDQESYKDRYARQAEVESSNRNLPPCEATTTERTETAGSRIPSHPPRFRREKKRQPQPPPTKVVDPNASVHVSRMNITEPDQAAEIAEFVLDELASDVEQFLEKYPPKTKRLYTESVSSISITSQDHDMTRLYVNVPSTMDLYYEKRENELKLEPLPVIAEVGGVDEETQVHLHRSRRRFDRQAPGSILDREAQTREMTMLNANDAERVYRHMHPLNDNYVPPKTPSRQASLQLNVDAAEQAPKHAGRPKVGAKITWGKKPRVLPPLPQDYHRVESFWTGSTYTGKYVGKQFENGRYKFPLMSVYESEFHDGHIETKKHLGVVTYWRGDRFEGNWRRGRYEAGRITFVDGLEFSPLRWTYCTPPDRRFYVERDVGMKQAGRTLYNNRLPPPVIPPGCYDTGDGIFDRDTRKVTAFTGQVLRIADDLEVAWILENCLKSKPIQERYIPRFNTERLPCSYEHKTLDK